VDPLPTIISGDQGKDDAVRRHMRKSGYRRNVFAGQMTPNTGGATNLGGTTA
jgi:hypothetical protein